MALNDILPYNSSAGGHCRVMSYGLDGSASFLRGEPVMLDGGGVLNVTGNDPDFVTEDAAVVGIAMVGAQQYSDALGTGTISDSANEPIQVAVFDLQTEFYTRNMFDGGSSATFAVGNIGDECNLELVSSSWGVDVDPANFNFIVTGLLDNNGQDAIRSGTTVTGVRFRLSNLPA